MANHVCPNCGQEYSDTYRKCPFCEEAEAEKRGRPIRRRGGKRLSKRKRSAGAGGVMLSVMAVVIIGVVGYVFFGDEIAGLAGIRTEADQTVDRAGTDDGAAAPLTTVEQESPDTAVPPDDSAGEGTQGTGGPLTLDYNAISIPAGETALLSVTGGTGAITWSTSNEHIATVANGSVTGVAGGTATITAVAGEETVECIVTVTGEPWVSDANLSLNKTDFTLYSDNPDVQMEVRGTDSTVAWASENPAVATISETGVVKWAGKGTTNVTATVDGQVLTCIVRCH